jgi:uncharacterized membrane protein (UPF0127 family)
MPIRDGHTIIPLFEGFCRKTQVDGLNIIAKIGNHRFKLKVLSTPVSQMKGYMDSQEAPKNGEGMLFVYDMPLPLEFWMKNVPFDLDIIFFDEDRNYIGHQTMKAGAGIPDDRLVHYRSNKKAQFAVEVTAGWCDTNLTKDSQLKF